jgi:hypothetical protein
MAKVVLLSLFIGALTSCASMTPRPSNPSVVPAGWVADYDFSRDIWGYLREQFNAAVVEGATAYIYIYSDRNPHCIRVRKMIARGQVAAFNDVRITLLSYDRLRRVFRDRADVSFDPGPVQPVIVKIASNGGLTTAHIYPDWYLYHPEWFMRLGLQVPEPMSPAALETELKAFFRSNSE